MDSGSISFQVGQTGLVECSPFPSPIMLAGGGGVGGGGTVECIGWSGSSISQQDRYICLDRSSISHQAGWTTIRLAGRGQ